ncbi:hypothetical protein [Ferrovibrio sp.]|uniref:hypothetical protein n=1 Tax=Ferrovibrio sp. TaxID=1917215 RepID=UPI0035ADA311
MLQSGWNVGQRIIITIRETWGALGYFAGRAAGLIRHKPKTIAALTFVAYAAVVFAMILPGLRYGGSEVDYRRTEEIRQYVETQIVTDLYTRDMVQAAQQSRLREPVRFRSRPNPFLELIYSVQVYYAESGERKDEPKNSVSARVEIQWDTVVVTTALLMVVLGIAYAFVQWSRITEQSAEAGDSGEAGSGAILDRYDRVLVHQMNISWARARNADFRALAMLAAGVFFAILGIVAFYYMVLSIEVGLSQPDGLSGTAVMPKAAVPSDLPVWIIYLRPVSVLIAAELIAFFLLRQYRSLIDDQKWFFKVFVRRGNFLAAAQLAAQPKTEKGVDAVVAMLLSEQFSTRLGKHETTEELKSTEVEAGSLNSLLATISKLIRGEK